MSTPPVESAAGLSISDANTRSPPRVGERTTLNNGKKSKSETDSGWTMTASVRQRTEAWLAKMTDRGISTSGCSPAMHCMVTRGYTRKGNMSREAQHYAIANTCWNRLPPGSSTEACSTSCTASTASSSSLKAAWTEVRVRLR